MAGKEEMKQEAGVMLHGLWRNLPAIFTICGVGLWINNGLIDAKRQSESLTVSVTQIQQTIQPLNNLEYRLTRAENYLNEAHTRIDNLSNTMINNIDLIRRDVNRLTTQVEVLSSQIGILMGEDPIPPRRRISRPGGPIPVE